MEDIQNRQDIEFLINRFYEQVLADELIGFIFTDVAQLDFKTHLPVMYEFWDSLLFGTMKYKGNVMIKHLELNKRESLHPAYFDRWLMLWESTVTTNFMGAKAHQAIQRATQIGALMKYKIQQDNLEP